MYGGMAIYCFEPLLPGVGGHELHDAALALKKWVAGLRALHLGERVGGKGWIVSSAGEGEMLRPDSDGDGDVAPHVSIIGRRWAPTGGLFPFVPEETRSSMNFLGRNGDAPEQNSERTQHACMPYQLL